MLPLWVQYAEIEKVLPTALRETAATKIRHDEAMTLRQKLRDAKELEIALRPRAAGGPRAAGAPSSASASRPPAPKPSGEGGERRKRGNVIPGTSVRSASSDARRSSLVKKKEAAPMRKQLSITLHSLTLDL